MNEKAADSVNLNIEENYKIWESLSKVVSLKVKNKQDSYGKFASRLPKLNQFVVVCHSLW